jgi:hypothetical protein
MALYPGEQTCHQVIPPWAEARLEIFRRAIPRPPTRWRLPPWILPDSSLPQGGKTIADLYAASAQLGGKSVKVRGKVVKYNANILGKNWLHLQDGTGSAGSNDLLVTTSAEAKRGDTVLIEGQVALNKDFGAGYKYNLLVEDAKVTVE